MIQMIQQNDSRNLRWELRGNGRKVKIFMLALSVIDAFATLHLIEKSE